MSKEIFQYDFTYRIPALNHLRSGFVYARTRKAAIEVFNDKLAYCKPEILSIKKKRLKMQGAEPTLITFDEANK